MTMTVLAAGATVFVLIHLLVSGTAMRGRLIARVGTGVYMAGFSVVSAAALAVMIWAYLAIREPQASPLWAWRHLAVALMWPAVVLIVCGLTQPGPTAVGGASALSQDDPVRGIHRVTRHPFLAGMTLWALIHAIWNPDPAALWFFGAFLIVAAAGTRLIDRKRRASAGAQWNAFAAATSIVPFGAIITGRQHFRFGEIGAWRVVIATIVWAAVASSHAALFDMPVV